MQDPAAGIHEREWPADAEHLDEARTFLQARTGRVVIAFHPDVDGLASAEIIRRTLAGRGLRPLPLPAKRGEHVHADAMRDRIRGFEPDALIVADMGTRPSPVGAAVPTLVVDHHDASQGVPPDALVVNGYDRRPVATTSVLAYAICRGLPGAEGTDWLAALGAVGDLGSAAPFSPLLAIPSGGAAWSKASGLLNAARRAPQDDAAAALAVLQAARSVEDIAHGRVPGVEVLERYREVVQAEVARCSRVPPRYVGGVAVIRFTSAAQVHPVIATRWTRRLAPAIVVAANDGYLPGRVNFAIRCAGDVNLLAWLRGLPFAPSPGAEYANGHARATGGSLDPADFERFLDALRAAKPAETSGGVTRPPRRAAVSPPAAAPRAPGRRPVRRRRSSG